jgi:hypothetical protein
LFFHVISQTRPPVHTGPGSECGSWWAQGCSRLGGGVAFFSWAW